MPYAIYHGAYKSDITGDRNRAAVYSRFIRTKFAFLDNQRKITGLPLISRTWNMADGTVITLTINAGQFRSVVYVPYIQKAPKDYDLEECFSGILATPRAASSPSGWGRPLHGPDAVDQLGTPDGPDPHTLYHISSKTKATRSYHPFADPYELLPSGERPGDTATDPYAVINYYTSYKHSTGKFLVLPMYCQAAHGGAIPTRYNSVGGAKIIYFCGEVYASHPTKVIEGCLICKDTTVSPNVTYLYILTTNEDRDVCTVWRRPDGKKSVTADVLYDAAHPDGWQEVFSYSTPNLDAIPHIPSFFGYHGGHKLDVGAPLASIGVAAGSATTGKFVFTVGVKNLISITYPGYIGSDVAPLGHVSIDVVNKVGEFHGTLSITDDYQPPTSDNPLPSHTFVRNELISSISHPCNFPGDLQLEEKFNRVELVTQTSDTVYAQLATADVTVAVDYMGDDLLTLTASEAPSFMEDHYKIIAERRQQFRRYTYCNGHVEESIFDPTWTLTPSKGAGEIKDGPREVILTLKGNPELPAYTLTLLHIGQERTLYTFPDDPQPDPNSITYAWTDRKERISSTHLLGMDLRSSSPMSYIEIIQQREIIAGATQPLWDCTYTLYLEGVPYYTHERAIPATYGTTAPGDPYGIDFINLPMASVSEMFFFADIMPFVRGIVDHYGNSFISAKETTFSYTELANPVKRGFNQLKGPIYTEYTVSGDDRLDKIPAFEGVQKTLNYYSPNAAPFPLIMNDALYQPTGEYRNFKLI